MHGMAGVVVGLVIFAIGFAGLGLAVEQMMSHADPSSFKTVAGLGVFVLAALGSLRLIS